MYVKDLDLVFVHIPKTGGTFIRKFLIENFEIQHIGGPHDFPEMIVPEFQDKNKFVFVRDPATWYQSMWSWTLQRIEADHPNWKKMPNGWAYGDHPAFKPNHLINLCCGDPDFNTFMRNILQFFPKYVSWLYVLYTAKCDYVGTFENLIDDLDTLFKSYGLDMREKLENTPKAPETQTKKEYREKAIYDERIEAAVRFFEPYSPEKHFRNNLILDKKAEAA